MGKKQLRKITLGFTVLECQRCGDQRLATQRCDTCQASPKAHETQNDLQRRRRVVAEFRRDRANVDPQVLNAQLRNEDRSHYIDSVIEAIAEVARSRRDATQLLSAMSALDQYVAAWQLALPRPMRNEGKLQAQAMSLVAEGAENLISTLIASNILEAQRFEELAQQKWDRAEELFADIEKLEKLCETISAVNASRVLNTLGQKAREFAVPEHTLHALDAALVETTGRDAESYSGMGLQLWTVRQLSLGAFDADMAAEIIRTTERAVLANPACGELFESELWKRGYARSSALMSGALANVQRALTDSQATSLEMAHEMVSAVTTYRDSTIRHALASMFASSVAEYAKMTSSNAGKLIKKAASTHPHLYLNENLTDSFRKAGAHADTDFAGGRYLVGGENLTEEEFLDRYLAYVESAVSMQVGVTSAAVSLGLDIDTNRYLSPRDREVAIAGLIGIYDLCFEDLREDGSTIRVDARGPESDWMPLAASISGIVGDHIEDLKLRVTDGGETYTLEVHLPTVRIMSGGIEDVPVREAILRMADIASLSRLNRESILPLSTWSSMLDALEKELEHAQPAEWIRSLRRFRAAAAEAGMVQVASSCTNAIRTRRRSISLAPLKCREVASGSARVLKR